MKDRLCSEELWEEIRWYLPPPAKTGRPRSNDREVFEAILWVLKTGARWRDLPDRYPHPTTCWRRLKRWEEEGIWEKIWASFVERLSRKEAIDWSEAFADASFAPAKRGAIASDPPSGAKEQSGWWWLTAKVFLWRADLPPRLPQK